MSGNENLSAVVYILDDNTISQVWHSYYRDIFPSFWERFDRLARAETAMSVDPVRGELLANRRVAGAVDYLERLNSEFFAQPTDREQSLVDEMNVTLDLSAAVRRWQAKSRTDADPYLIAKGLVSPVPATVVTEENQDLDRTAGIPYVCHYFGVDCINLHQMTQRLGWRF